MSSSQARNQLIISFYSESIQCIKHMRTVIVISKFADDTKLSGGWPTAFQAVLPSDEIGQAGELGEA